MIQGDTRLNGDVLLVRIEVHYLVEMFADIDDQRFADGLTAL